VSLVHLHRHSEWSLGDGLGTNEMYAERASELGQPALAITDHGSLAGTLYHMQACEKVGIKPILGMEAYFRGSIPEDRNEKRQYGYFHLVLLAQNMEGWRNLMKLSSLSHHAENFYQVPSIDLDILADYTDGLIATSSCLQGVIHQAVLHGDTDAAQNWVILMQDFFGDRFYFEIQPHDLNEQRLVNEYAVGMAKGYGIPFIATSDVHSPYADWVDTQALKQKIAYNKSADDGGKEYGGLPTTYLMSADELRQAFAQYHSTLRPDEIDEAIKETVALAERCENITVDKSPKVPKATRSTLEAERVLREWCEEGLKRIGKENDETYRARMEEEFAVMRKIKVLDYFVFVGDMVRWAKSRGIRVGPGRGSAGGSLVCFLSRITAMDPIGYDLLFERFLNEYRTEIPDIDLDFDPERRHEVKEYLIEKWGADHVIDVAAFQSFGLKAAIKDVARTLGVNYEKTHRVTEAFPEKTYEETLETLEEKLPSLKEYFVEFPEVRHHAMRLQQQIKGISKHAAAVIVTDRPAEDIIPLMQSKDGGIVTQWSERANGQLLSPYGFLKVDMLVTDALTAQARTIALVKERHGVTIDFEDPDQFPVIESPLFSDPKVIEVFAHGRTLGVFQFGSAGIRGLLKNIQPENLDHVIAANAMYRPGPMAFMDEYADRKNGRVKWELPHPDTEQFLAKTFGIILYQEQVMQMYRALGKNVDSSESAVFLKVVAKGIARDVKGKEKLQAYYDKFAAGCAEKGIPKRAYDELWQQILQMTTYAFNRSHAGGYALQAYQDAYLKAYCPLEYYAALLSLPDAKIPQIIRESRAYGVTLMPPDINTSGGDFTIDGNAIRFGLLAVAGIGDAALRLIKEHRPYTSLADFEERVPKRGCNSRARKALIDAGAFDTLGERADWSEKDKMASEKATLKVALSVKSDFEKYRKMMKEFIDPESELATLQERNDAVQVGGEVVAVKEYVDKNGNTMAFVDIEFDGDKYSCTFFAEQYGKCRHMLTEGAAVLVRGAYDPERESIVVYNCVTAEQLASDIRRSNASRSNTT
jgi:DNA polymerase-3 subunit alpha